MNVFRSVGLAGWAWRRAAGQMARPALWLPFLAVASVQALVLLWLLSAHQTWAQPTALAVVRGLAGEAGVHYPGFYRALPVAFARSDLFLGVLFGALAGGAATVLFARAMGREGAGSAWGAAGSRYLHLVILYAAVAASIFLIFSLPRVVSPEVRLGSAPVRWAIRLGTLAVAIAAQAVLVYGTAWIMLAGRNALGAIAGSVRTAGGVFLATTLLVGFPALIQYPLSYLQGRGDLLITKFSPELMTAVLATWILVQIPLGFLLTGSVTALYLRREEER